ncbi:glycosyltransferase family 4 protein [Streptomyces sp. NBC_01281]|uniref:glycosyltransferase family 4 protein n=1 Tax=unclassified Streptomyces TaxID=2593676 RepID=UPI002DD7EA13|nr:MULTISPECIES: glycosyltransferase family 4 protein [unclassified Streptomyces]WSD76047.1 glycosyltransferase family 4 protein [Streptomyces sp. NBC_01558]WSK59479.1 glycosyltransferase family 4 protein [Streptomyces sp. NBC_01281]
MKIAFLINNAYGIGGTIRATANLAGAFTDRHEVEVVSVHRVQDEPAIPLHPRVTLTSLIDMREDSPTYEGDDPLTGQPCTMFPDTGAAANSARLPYSALQDDRIGTWLRTTDADIVIATRPDLNGYLARDGQPRYLRIGQEHLSLDAHNPTLRGHQNKAIAGLDAFITVSEADAAQYRNALTDLHTRILCIPNAVPTPDVELAGLGSKVIVAAGRLVSVKRYDRLVDAFSKVADAHPDWTLRIYGRGPEKTALRARIDELGLYDRIFLMGPVSPIETEWAKGAIAAVSSDMESFGMTIVEAMHCGVPVIATDCPHGPAEIIDHNTNGLLVDLDSGTDGYATALNHLMNDEEQRRRLGPAARERAADFAPPAIADRYETLIGQLQAMREQGKAGRRGRGHLLSRLRSAIPTVRPAAHTAASTTASPVQEKLVSGPVATARVLASGALSVRLDAGALPSGPLDFLARMRRDPKGREIRLPFPDAATAPGQAPGAITLEADRHQLAEGRWDCYVLPRDAPVKNRIRLTCRLAEQARSVGRPPTVTGDVVISRLPYTTADGYLALRVWQRPAHAEITSIAVTADHAVVSARLLAPGPTSALPDTAAVVAISRQGQAHDIVLPITQIGPWPGHFTCTVPYASALAERVTDHDLWDLYLRLNATGAPIPIGRIGGDIVDRKTTDTVPAAHLTHPTRGATRTKPFFTMTNDLALSLRDTEATD